MEAPTDGNAPCTVGAKRLPDGELAAAYRPLTQALERRFGQRVVVNHSQELLTSRRCQEGKTLGGLRSGHSVERVRKPRPTDLEPEQCRWVKDSGWTGQRPVHPNRRHDCRRARRRRATEDGVPKQCSSTPLWQKLVGAPMVVVPDHTPRDGRHSHRHFGLCDGCWGRRDV
ncbi:unnamed protein product [Boreogadus saida]